MPTFTFRLLLIALLLGGVTSTAAADARGDARQHVDFGIKVAQAGLWREAVQQWERATELDPSYAAAFNNLAIAYEQHGEFEKASAAYARALKLDPGNSFIRQNYELFREVHDRMLRQRAR
jgi:type IV pilus assembly protein PilF